MPFLRRRGVMASETDMRLPSLFPTRSKQSSTASLSQQLPQPGTSSQPTPSIPLSPSLPQPSTHQSSASQLLPARPATASAIPDSDAASVISAIAPSLPPLRLTDDVSLLDQPADASAASESASATGRAAGPAAGPTAAPATTPGDDDAKGDTNGIESAPSRTTSAMPPLSTTTTTSSTFSFADGSDGPDFSSAAVIIPSFPTPPVTPPVGSSSSALSAAPATSAISAPSTSATATAIATATAAGLAAATATATASATTTATAAAVAALTATPSATDSSSRGVVFTEGTFSDRPTFPLINDQSSRQRRFSLLRFRNASDSQLASRAKQQALAEQMPPMPSPPVIIATAPTFELSSNALEKKPSRLKLAGFGRKSSDLPRIDDESLVGSTGLNPATKANPSKVLFKGSSKSSNTKTPNGKQNSTSFRSWPKRDKRKSVAIPPAANGDHPADPFAPGQSDGLSDGQPLPAYDEEAGTTVALPLTRLSESSRSDGSSGDRVYGSTTTTTHTIQTTTTFFRLPRRRKNSNPPPLFPIAHLPQKKRPTTSSDSSSVPPVPPIPHSLHGHRPSAESSSTLDSVPRMSVSSTFHSNHGGLSSVREGQQTPTQSRPATPSRTSSSVSALALSPARALFQKGNHSPATAFFRPNSRHSGQSSPTRSGTGGAGGIGGLGAPAAPGTGVQGNSLHVRERSSTLSSLNRDSMDERQTTQTVRSSSSATGRKSFGDLLGLNNRWRQNSDLSIRQGTLTPATPGSNTSKNNSLHLARDSITLPERRDDDTPAKYLARLEEVVSRSVIASALSKSTDTFSQAVLRSYMRSFKFFGEPMDMAIRKLLMEAELPKETQQIDRCLQAFANRYHECNPGIYSSPDQAYFIAFSLLILHTDVFNKNNKHKMQKPDYLKNTRGEGIFDEILEVFYDNITYTPFIHVEDDIDINGERIVAHKAKRKSIFPNTSPDLVKKSAKEPLDPYTLIIDDKLDILRPNLRDVMQLDDPYSYLGTATELNMKELQRTFFRTGVLQIVSARSRPDAFMTEKTASNPEEAHPGIVDIKITKVGLLWRKDIKKKKARSPWQEWGAILTGAQLYFFHNTAWVKGLMHQYEAHVRHGHEGIPIIFKPPLHEFKPDALISTDGAVALLDSSYKKHKHAFTYVRHGGEEEVLLADNEEEMNDWLAKLNYAAAFRTSGVRMRGVVGGLYEGQQRRALRQLESADSQAVQTPSGEVKITRSRIDQKMAEDILAARRDIMLQKVADSNEKLELASKKLEEQLRNSRHLQIMSPIQPKTREQMLHTAARLSTQVKWTMVEMWRIRCHRDILEMDLDEERQVLGPEHALESGAALAGMVAAASGVSGIAADASAAVQQQVLPQRPSLSREESRTSSAAETTITSTSQQQKQPQPPQLPQQPQSPQLTVHRGSVAGISIASVGSASIATAISPAMEQSPMSEVFQTPPTSATATMFHQHRHQLSAELTPTFAAGMTAEGSTSMEPGSPDLRKGSVSSAVSAGTPPITATPPRVIRNSMTVNESAQLARQTAGAKAVEDGVYQQQQHVYDHEHEHDVDHEVDADEQNLLEKTGLLSGTSNASKKGKGVALDDTVTTAAGSAQALASAQTPGPSADQTPSHQNQHQHKDGQGTAQQGQNGSTAGSHDRSKIRRSLQRTIRESAGHLSHHRSNRRGRDTQSGGDGAGGTDGNAAVGSGSGAAGSEDGIGDQPQVLERGTGSFVVHGKKASVISFGGDLQSIMPPEERIRQRKSLSQQQQQQLQAAPMGQRTSVASATSIAAAATAVAAATIASSHSDLALPLSEESEDLDDGGSGVGGSTAGSSDFRTAMLQHQRNRERRESAASASTATARSFRALHRKYSSVRAASQSSAGRGGSANGLAGGSATAASTTSTTTTTTTTIIVHRDDEASLAAGAVGDVHMPLTPALEETESSNGDARKRNSKISVAVADGEESLDDGDDEADEDEEEDGDSGIDSGNNSDDSEEEDAENDDRSLLLSPGAGSAQFFTPDPPASPLSMRREASEASEREEAEADRGEDQHSRGSSSNLVQALSVQAIHA